MVHQGQSTSMELWDLHQSTETVGAATPVWNCSGALQKLQDILNGLDRELIVVFRTTMPTPLSTLPLHFHGPCSVSLSSLAFGTN